MSQPIAKIDRMRARLVELILECGPFCGDEQFRKLADEKTDGGAAQSAPLLVKPVSDASNGLLGISTDNGSNLKRKRSQDKD